MKKDIYLMLFMACMIFLLSGTARADNEFRRFGFGFTVSESSSSVMGIIWINEKVTLEPAVGISIMDTGGGSSQGSSITRFSPALGFAAHMRPNEDMRPYLGIQISASILSAAGRTYTDISFGPYFGCEYYLSSHFSISGELNLIYTKTDDKYSATRPEANASYIETGQKLLVFYYF